MPLYDLPPGLARFCAVLDMSIYFGFFDIFG